METRHQGVPVSRLQCRRAVVEVGDAPTLNSRWNVDCAERVQSGHQHSRWNVDRAERVQSGPSLCRGGRGLMSASGSHQGSGGSRTELVGRHKSSWGAAEVPRFWLRGTRALVSAGCGGMAGKGGCN